MTWYLRYFFGTNGADTITANNYNNVIFAFGGNDTVFGLGGHDRIFGFSGDDILDGGTGNDRLYGGSGNDTLIGGEGCDLLFGGSGNDMLDGGAHNDALYGGSGDDILLGGAGHDRLYGGSGEDSLDGGTGNDRLSGGNGNDTLDGGAGHDRLYGGRGDDILSGGDGNDRLSGSSGDDVLHGGAGYDRLYGGGGDDELDGGAGSDYVNAGRGDDVLSFDSAENNGAYDRYVGSRGVDTLVLHLTAAEFADADVADDLLGFLQHIADHTHSNGQVWGPSYYFSELNLRVYSIENLRVFVDGVEVDPNDAGGGAGGNDPIALDDSFTTDENGILSDDVTANDTFDAGTTVSLISGVASGTLVLNADGTFDFDPGADFDALAVGESANVSFVYELSGGGATNQGAATITITGTNDAPTVAVAVTAAGVEGGAGFSVDMLAGASDVDNGAVLSVTNVTGLAAGVTFAGSTLSVDPSDAAFQGLAAGETLDIIVSYDVTDEHGASVPQTATITITGTNDMPTVGAALSAAANEDDAAFTLDLTSGASDVDVNDVLGVSNVAGLTAGVTLVGNALAIDPSDAAFQSLAAGETLVITVTYDVDDSNGGTAAQSATITLTGTNDAPTIAAAVVAAGAEDGAGFTVDMLIGASDVDNGAVLSIANVTGLAAGVIFAGTGLTVDPSDAAFQSLAIGETLDIIVSYDVVDEHGASVAQTATITIAGTNDAPTVGAAITAAANEDDASFSVDMLAGASDIDTSDVLSVANAVGLTAGVTLSGTSLNIDPSDSAFQSLALGAVLSIIVSYDVVDSFGGVAAQTATITITGTNDAPVVSAVTGAASEDGPAITLTADFSDIDAGDTHTFSVDTVSTAGLVTDNGDGTFDYDPSGSFESLAVGETATDTFAYTVIDNNGGSATNTVTVTITGANDAPSVTAALTAAANEDDAGFTVDMLSGASDIDASDVLSVANVTGLTAGVTFAGSTISVDPADAAFQALALGEVLNIVVSYDVVDGNGGAAPQTATITITGTNDAPNVAVALTAAANEDDAGFTLDMLAGASDIDNGVILSVTNVTGLASGVSFVGSTLTVDPSDAAFQSLAVGATLDIVVSYDVTDEHGASVAQTATITITGNNDAPVVTAAITASGFETDAIFAVDLLANASDIDVGDVLNATNITLVSGDDSGVTISGNSLSVDPSAYAALNAGETEIIVYSYDVSDGNGGTVTQTATITIAGVGAGNGPPIVSGPVISTVSEDDAAFSVDLLDGASDPDAGDVLNVANLALTGGDDSGVTVNGNALDIDPDVYTALAVGESETITYSYDIEDGNGGTIAQTATITITGANDAPTVAAALTAAGTEDGPVFIADMLAGASDVDNGAVLSIANVSALPPGVVFDGLSTISVDPSDPGLQFLPQGATTDVIVTFDVVDEHGASVAQTLTITITGTNDVPTVAAALTAAANEDDAGFTVDMLSGAADVDFGTILAVTNVTGLTAGVTLTGVTLNVDPADAAFQSLALGEVLNIVVSYDIIDGAGGSVPQTATITLTGTNDAPVVAAALTAAANEDDASFTIDMLAGASDVDNGAVLSVANVIGVGAGMAFVGTNLIVDPFDAVFQSLALGETLNIVVSYDVVDEHGASVPQTATITITGTNDAPTVAGALSDAANEDDASFTIDMLAGAADIDTGAVLSVIGVSGLVPGVTFAGSTLTVDPSGAAFQSLALGEVQTIIVGYNISDEHGASVPQIANITITGTNDAPVVAAALTAAANEDDARFTLICWRALAMLIMAQYLSVANVTGLGAGVTFVRLRH